MKSKKHVIWSISNDKVKNLQEMMINDVLKNKEKNQHLIHNGNFVYTKYVYDKVNELLKKEIDDIVDSFKNVGKESGIIVDLFHKDFLFQKGASKYWHDCYMGYENISEAIHDSIAHWSELFVEDENLIMTGWKQNCFDKSIYQFKSVFYKIRSSEIDKIKEKLFKNHRYLINDTNDLLFAYETKRYFGPIIMKRILEPIGKYILQ